MRWWYQDGPLGRVMVHATDRGVARLTLPFLQEVLAPLVASDPPDCDVEVATLIDDVFEGRRPHTDLPVDFSRLGRAHVRRQVYETLRRDVGWGETVSYGELAELVERPRAARLVGQFMANNPVPFLVPCHRVIASGNRIGGYGGHRNAIGWKRALLAREGVTVKG